MTPDPPPPPTELPHTADSSAADPRHPAVPSAASPADAARSAELTALIRAEIESAPEGRITFARFMERALYEPELGYYRQRADRPTGAGDFLTAPETHPIFGWTIARRVEAMWVELGRPRPFGVVEFGAGSGTLGLSIFEGLRRHGATELLEAVRYQPVESNPHRLTDLRDRFEKAGLAGLLATSNSEPPASSRAGSTGVVPVTGVILANEFLDALAVHRVVVRGGRLLELFVAWQEGFVEVPGEPSTPDLARRLADDGFVADGSVAHAPATERSVPDGSVPDRLAEGQIAEICLGLAPWLDEVAARLDRGYMLAIDYGYDAAELYGPRRLAGTLLGYRGHRVRENPFDEVGLTDLTAHVDFTALRLLGERRGLRTVALTTQPEFLVAAGLEVELQALQASPETTAEDYMRARSGIVRMLDPRHMGRFRVLTLAKEPRF
jgi:SAM-dependent MidA family methyltransferase